LTTSLFLACFFSKIFKHSLDDGVVPPLYCLLLTCHVGVFLLFFLQTPGPRSADLPPFLQTSGFRGRPFFFFFPMPFPSLCSVFLSFLSCQPRKFEVSWNTGFLPGMHAFFSCEVFFWVATFFPEDPLFSSWRDLGKLCFFFFSPPRNNERGFSCFFFWFSGAEP